MQGGYRYSDKVEKYLPKSPTMSQTVAQVKEFIVGKPYDVYLYRWEKQPEFYGVAANKNFYNVVRGTEKEKHKPCWVQ